MSRKSQSTQAQVVESTNTNSQEEIMEAQNNEITLKDNEAAITTTGGNTIILNIEDLIAVKAMVKTMNKEYKRKSAETEYADHRPKPKGSVDYDRDMYGRTQVIEAFVNLVLDSIVIPERKDRTAQLLAAFGAKKED